MKTILIKIILYMIPIFEQGKGNGIGYSFDDFMKRFIYICESHLKNGNAKSFAFILYNFHDETVRAVLTNQGGFTRLDRLTGKELSIFYLNSDNDDLLKTFNNVFLGAFELEGNNNLPFVLFFDIYNREVENVEIVELEHTNIVFAFSELYNIIENRVSKNNNAIPKKNPSLGIFGYLNKIALDKFIEFLVEKALEYNGKIF